jgi:hypothetical protein
MADVDERYLERLKHDAEESLRRERLKLEFVKEHLAKSNTLSKRMVELLNYFSDQLSGLETAIRPVHLQTLNLTRARDNLNEVATTLGNISEHYETSLDVQNVLSQSPAYQLEQFVCALGKVQRAISFFQAINSNEVECKALATRLNQGHRALEAEFEQVLLRHSFALPVSDILDMSEDDVTQLSMLPGDVVNKLRCIVDYMTTAKCTSDIIRAYSKVRIACARSPLKEFVEAHVGAAPATNSKQLVRSATRKGHRKQPSSALRRMTQPDFKEENKRTSFDLNMMIDREIENLPGAYTKGSHAILDYFRVLHRLLR